MFMVEFSTDYHGFSKQMYALDQCFFENEMDYSFEVFCKDVSIRDFMEDEGNVKIAVGN